MHPREERVHGLLVGNAVPRRGGARREVDEGRGEPELGSQLHHAAPALQLPRRPDDTAHPRGPPEARGPKEQRAPTALVDPVRLGPIEHERLVLGEPEAPHRVLKGPCARGGTHEPYHVDVEELPGDVVPPFPCVGATGVVARHLQ